MTHIFSHVMRTISQCVLCVSGERETTTGGERCYERTYVTHSKGRGETRGGSRPGVVGWLCKKVEDRTKVGDVVPA